MSARLLHYPSFGYYSFYGKKIDPEPGRCRRTDGKKWRCSKDAHPDSKYCERHMNRGRYRSRKPVESQTVSQTLSTAKLDIATGSSGGGRSFQNMPSQSLCNPVNLCFGSGLSQLQVETSPYGNLNKYSELKAGGDAHKSMMGAPGTIKMSSLLDTHHAASQAPADLLSETGNSSPLQEFGRLPSDATPKQQKQHHFFGMDFSSPGPVKQEQQPVQLFFDDWSETRERRFFFDGQRSDMVSFSSAQSHPSGYSGSNLSDLSRRDA
ncbi:Growth-regulating factor [Psidium guajava]|nr:Growth-regulating factor [Psidium guajava]